MRKIVTGVVAIALVGASVTTASASPVPTCFGKKATVVGTNRDLSRTVQLKGTNGNDVIVGLEGSDRIEGRGGDDLICAGGGDDYIVAGPGDDKVKGGGHSDTIIGGRGRDRLWGGSGADSLSGGPGHDRLYGGAGHQDSLIGGPGNDVLDGGTGYDLAEFWDSPRGVEADLEEGFAGGHGNDELISIEGLVGSDFDDVLIGDDHSNDIQTGDGDDVVRALGSHLDGYMDILRSAGGNNLLDGGDGPDIVSYNLSPWPVSADLSSGTTTTDGFGSDTLVGIEHLTGSKGDDKLIGNDEDNVIIGNGGNDEMDGRGGIDELSFIESRMPVTASLGSGLSEADWWGSDTFVNFENLAGSAWKDELAGDEGPNLIWGGDRADSIEGLAGDDILLGAGGNDRADGGAGSDICDAEIEIDCELDPSTTFDVRAHSRFLASVGDGREQDGGPLSSQETCVPAKGRLAFVRDMGGSTGNEIFTVRPDGRGLSRLTNNRVDEWGPSWSPDGTRIAFSSNRQGNSEIYVMDRTGGNVERLTQNSAWDAVPAWSPDGRKIAFTSAREDPEGLLGDLFIMDADGANVTKLVGGRGTEGNVTWSPDGRHIAFDRSDSIFRSRSDGTNLKKLTSRRRMLATNPSWSNDGRRILFQAQRSEERGMDIFVMRRDGANKRALVAAPGDQQSPAWSPDDRRIAFSYRWRVAVARADGSQRRSLFTHDRADYAIDWGGPVRC